MFDPERLLGEMMRGALGSKLGGKRKKKRHHDWNQGLGGKATVGLGLLGVAMAAWEHFNAQSKSTANTNEALTGGATTSTTPMPPPPPGSANASMTSAVASNMPPPPPSGNPMATAASSIAAIESSNPFATAQEASQSHDAKALSRDETAKLLIHAMIAAASSDGAIDPDEHELIIERAIKAGLDADGSLFLNAAIAKPLSIEALAAQTPPELAAQVYASALIAIVADSEVENRFLNRLATALRLDVGTRAQIHAQLEADE